MLINRIKIHALLFTGILTAIALLLGVSCDDGGTTATGKFTGDFTQESVGYIAANPVHAIDWLKALFSPQEALALPNLSIPADEFTGPVPIPVNTTVNILGLDGAFIASGEADGAGHVAIDNIPEGYLNVFVAGGAGKTWRIPTHFLKNHGTYMRAVFKDDPDGKEAVYAKSVHNDAGEPANTDDFSLAVLGRPRATAVGGIIILHQDGRTFIDKNGDGDFIDTDDSIFYEADDDGISSAAGDGDEDNDGITDNHEQGDSDDLDGDGIANATDTDDDGDGILDSADSTPRGITALDDFVPPALIDPAGAFNGDPYSGIADVQPVWLDPEHTQPDLGKVRVFFPGAEDAMNNDISYRMYYMKNEFNFSAAQYSVFHPVVGKITTPGELYDFEISGLTPGDTYFFVVRALDSASPPNEDTNDKVASLNLPTG